MHTFYADGTLYRRYRCLAETSSTIHTTCTFRNGHLRWQILAVHVGSPRAVGAITRKTTYVFLYEWESFFWASMRYCTMSFSAIWFWCWQSIYNVFSNVVHFAVTYLMQATVRKLANSLFRCVWSNQIGKGSFALPFCIHTTLTSSVSPKPGLNLQPHQPNLHIALLLTIPCLLYTSDAADE